MMIQIPAKLTVFSAPRTLRTRHSRKLTRTITATRPVLQAKTANARYYCWDDVVNLAMVIALTLVVVSTTGWLARAFMNEILQYGGFDLLRAFGGM